MSSLKLLSRNEGRFVTSGIDWGCKGCHDSVLHVLIDLVVGVGLHF